TNEDITRSVLTQIIVEEEAKGTNLLPVSFLRQLIALYGDSLQALVPKYLEHSMSSFTQNQERMRQYINNALGGMFPFGSLEEMSRRNMEFLDQAFRAFNPLAGGQGGKGSLKAGVGGQARDAAARQRKRQGRARRAAEEDRRPAEADRGDGKERIGLRPPARLRSRAPARPAGCRACRNK